IAKKIAALVWDATGYRFIYKKATKSRTSDRVVTYNFFCAQNAKEVTKTRLVDDKRKRRARMKMDRFPCNGYLDVTADSDSRATVRLRVRHHRVHCQYVDISLDEKNYQDSRGNAEPTSLHFPNLIENLSQIWTRVLQENPGTEVTQKQIYALW
ncbi:hypothetical protein B0H11DRAFT_1659368, partial [Mycena galericulata]